MESPNRIHRADEPSGKLSVVPLARESTPMLDYARPESLGRRWLAWCAPAIAFVLAPFALMAVYLFFSRWPARIFTTQSDYMFAGVACVAGMPFALLLPLPLWVRLPLAIMYSVLVALVIERFMLYFVGMVFDDWL